jgi:hypothetical protein
MVDERTNERMAGEIVRRLLKFMATDELSGPDDPQLDDLSNLLRTASEHQGFTAELVKKMEAAGFEIPARTLTNLVILAAKRR